MNCTRHELRHCDRERMRKRDTSPLTSGPDRPAGPTRTTALQEILHCDLCAGISKTAALSASQLAAHLSLLHNTWCACRHRSRIRVGQVHRLPYGSDGYRVVREATLLTPLCARLHKNFHLHIIFHLPVSVATSIIMMGRRNSRTTTNSSKEYKSCQLLLYIAYLH